MTKLKSRLKYMIIGDCIMASSLIASCTKVETTKTYTVSDITSQSTIAFDEVTVNNELDQFVDDGIRALCNPNTSIAGGYSPDSPSPGFMEIVYDGFKYDVSKTRAGVDSIHFNQKSSWANPGATATLTFTDKDNSTGYEVQFYTIISPSIDSASLTFLGSITITNVSGGLLQNLTAGDSLVIHIQANNLKYSFNDQLQTVQFFPLSIDEIRTFTMKNDTIYATTRGNTTINGYSNIGTWGIDRFGNNYYSATTASVVQNITNLNLSYNPLSGAKIIEGIAEPISSIYGRTSFNTPQMTGQPYGFLISWTDNTIHTSDVLRYYY